MTSETDKTWLRTIERRFSTGINPVDEPVSLLVTGLDGAGKSTLVEAICRWFIDRGLCVTVDAEDLRLLFPSRSDREVVEWGQMIDATQGPVADACALLTQNALEQKLNLIVETSFGDWDVEAFLDQYSAAGRSVDVIAMTASFETCQEAQLQRQGYWLRNLQIRREVDSLESIEQSGDQLLQNLTKAAKNQQFKTLTVIDRFGEIVGQALATEIQGVDQTRELFIPEHAEDEPSQQPLEEEKAEPAIREPVEGSTSTSKVAKKTGKRGVKLGNFKKKRLNEEQDTTQEPPSAASTSSSPKPSQRGMQIRIPPKSPESGVEQHPRQAQPTESVASMPEKPDAIEPEEFRTPESRIATSQPQSMTEENSAIEIVEMRPAADVSVEGLSEGKKRLVKRRLEWQKKIRDSLDQE